MRWAVWTHRYLTPAAHDIAVEGGLMPDVLCADHPRVDARGELASDACLDQAARYVVSHARPNNNEFGRLLKNL